MVSSRYKGSTKDSDFLLYGERVPSPDSLKVFLAPAFPYQLYSLLRPPHYIGSLPFPIPEH